MRLTSIVCFALAVMLVPIGANAAQERCRCEFSSPPWEAIGSNAACTTFSKKDRTSCEIAFGSLGADPSIAKEVLGEEQFAQYEKEQWDILIMYLSLVRTDQQVVGQNKVTDRGILRTLIPSFMRAAYLRPG